MSKHRGERPQRPFLLIGTFVVIASVLVGAFAWAGSQDEIAPTAGDAEPLAPAVAAGDVAGAVASDTTTTAETATSSAGAVRSLGNFQRGYRVRQIKPVCSRVPVSAQLTVLSYNIKTARAGSLSTIANVIRAADADVVLLQEVDRHRRVSGNLDQAGWLASNLGGWSHVFGQNVSYGGSAGYGTAIISRWPIVSSNNWHLPNVGGGQQRGLLKAVVDVDGVQVSFYSTHLQPGMDALRTRQARTVASLTAGDGNPSILGGDMNSWPTSHWIQILRSQFTDTWDVAGHGKGATYPARGPRTRIDYLMHRGSALSAVSADVLGSLASDHRAVRARYQLDGLTEKQCTTPTG